MNDERLNEGWHLDKRVPVAIILAVILQLVTFTWWMSALTSDVEQNSDAILRHNVELRTIRENNRQQTGTLSRIEEQIVALRRDLQFTMDRLINEE